MKPDAALMAQLTQIGPVLITQKQRGWDDSTAAERLSNEPVQALVNVPPLIQGKSLLFFLQLKRILMRGKEGALVLKEPVSADGIPALKAGRRQNARGRRKFNYSLKRRGSKRDELNEVWNYEAVMTEGNSQSVT